MKRKTLKRKISIVGILVFVSMIVYSCWQDEWSSNVTDEVIFDSNKELEGVSKCTPSFFYAQSPDFHKLGLCYYLKILYL